MSLYDSIGYIQDGALFITKNGWCCFLLFITYILVFVRLTDLFVNLWFYVIDKIKDWREKNAIQKNNPSV